MMMNNPALLKSVKRELEGKREQRKTKH